GSLASTWSISMNLETATRAGQMHASSRKLAITLAERLGKVVPSPLTLRVHGSGISLYGDGELLGGSSSAEILDDEDGSPFQERVGTATGSVLSEIQDCVMRYLREEW